MLSAVENVQELEGWLESFVREHGRAPRILHIGNIANNAYLNAKMLNAAGFDCDVIAYDYYHIMGCPEWEDADFDGGIDDHFHPDWDSVEMNGFKRPRWFAQGPFDACVAYLIARRASIAGSAEQADETDRLWRDLEAQAAATVPPRTSAGRALRLVIRKGKGARRRLIAFARSSKRALSTLAGEKWNDRWQRGWDAIDRVWGRISMSSAPIFLLLRRANGTDAGSTEYLPGQAWRDARVSAANTPTTVPQVTGAPIDSETDLLLEAFHAAFPDRPDQLRREDVFGYASVVPRWRELLSKYDAVVGYATDGVFPLLCNARPYIAFEHGTIRNIPFEPTTQGRLCAITYRLAGTALITNCDNIDAAHKLELDNYRFVPHPVNESHVATNASVKLASEIRRELDCDFLLFHPSRQHWEKRRHPDWEKGNDILIRGFASFIREACPTGGAVFVDWGAKVAESKALLEELGVADRVMWIPPQPNRRMILYVEAADVVADQFYLGAFGSLTPKALLHGCPVLLHLDEERHRWCMPELPPVINVNTPVAIDAALRRLYAEPAYRQRLIDEGRAWYDRHHSNHVIVETFADSIMRAMPARGEPAVRTPPS